MKHGAIFILSLSLLGGCANQPPAAPKSDTAISHINRIHKSKSAGASALIDNMLKNQPQRQPGDSPGQP
jgi:hypothetical protein